MRSLRLLVIPVHRFGMLRVTTGAERQGAGGRLLDGLSAALQEASDVPVSLAAADRRARLTARPPGDCVEASR